MPNMIAEVGGQTKYFPDNDVEWALSHGWVLESPYAKVDRLTEQALDKRYSGAGNTVKAAVYAGLRGITMGATDALIRAGGDEGELLELRELRQRKPILSAGAEILGSLATAKIPIGLGSRTGSALIGGAGPVAQIARTGVSGGVAGGFMGLGQGVTDVALSEEPITAERVASSLSSNFLSGAGIGAAAGTASKALELGLVRAGSSLRARAANARAGAAPDVAKAQLADDILAHQKDLSEKKIWLATKDADVKKLQVVKEAAKVSRDADMQLRRLGNNPKGLAKNPATALRALQTQEHALEMIQSQDDKLRGIFAGDTTATRVTSLNALPMALDRNRALQQQIEALAVKAEKTESMAEKLLAGGVFSLGAGAAQAIPGVRDIPGIGAIAGTAAMSVMGSKLAGRMAAANIAVAERTAKAADAFASIVAKATPYTPVLATKVLEAARFASAPTVDDATAIPSLKTQETPGLARAFKARAAEIRSHMTETPEGPRVRVDARERIGRQLDPIRTVRPRLADQIETIAVRRLEFLARKIPRKPDIAGLPIGPDRWQPSDMEMRSFARYVAATEDPGGIEERLASGTVTPEDAEVMREVYPERLAEMTRLIIERLPSLRANLPYKRQLALSILTGVPVTAAMDPRILAALQAQYVNEPGTEGGIQAPVPMPQFGSVRKSDLHPTPSQERDL